jgi:WD40 repeat protein
MNAVVRGRVAAAVAATALGLAAAGIAAPAAGSARPAFSPPGRAASPAAGPAAGVQLWARRYNGPAGGADSAAAIAAGQGGRMVFVTGRSQGGESGWDYATVGYSAATGAQRWVARYAGPGRSRDAARAVAISPDGRIVFVTGDSGRDAATVAYRAASGARLWVRRYRGPGYRSLATSIAVSPDGAVVFVTGGSNLSTSPRSAVDWAFTTIAYDAATGARLWTARYSGPGSAHFSSAFWALAVAVSPDSARVYVTGTAAAAGNLPSTATVAYDAATGARLWARSQCCVHADSMALSPDGSTVFTTSVSEFGPLVAYDAATGAKLWENDSIVAVSPQVAVRPGGHLVAVAGNDLEAFNAATGAVLWQDHLPGPAVGLAFGHGGRTLYQTGTIAGRAGGSAISTRAYDASTGTLLWSRSYAALPGGGSNSAAIAINPVTGAVYVTGSSAGPGSGQDYATVAYRG